VIYIVAILILWPVLRLVGDFVRFATPFFLAIALIAALEMAL
jgi:hypothetical protein